MDIDFKAIVPMPAGGQHAAFEELCCQLARCIEGARKFVRLQGDGGDGGIECYAESPAGMRGWQAKYVFDMSRLLKQASKSFRRALENYPDLTTFILCFPFDPTGRTRRGKGGDQKLADWKRSELSHAKDVGRGDVEIEFWPASDLCDRIIKYDVSGGKRHFFFGERILTNQWFEDHLAEARAIAGPRYTPQLNVATDMETWFAAFGRTRAWSNALLARLRALQKELDHLRVSNADTGTRAENNAVDSLDDPSPSDSKRRVAASAATIKKAVATLQQTEDLDNRREYVELRESLQSAADDLRSIAKELALDINRRHGEGTADSPGFRQYMAERMGSLPAANLDSTRSVSRRSTRSWNGSTRQLVRSHSRLRSFSPARRAPGRRMASATSPISAMQRAYALAYSSATSSGVNRTLGPGLRKRWA